MLRRMKELRRSSLLDDLAVLHHGDTIRHLADYSKIVRYEEHGKVVRHAEPIEQRKYLSLHGDVKRRCRLVCNQKPWAIDDGHRNQDALALAAGELVRIVVDTALRRRQCDLVHRLQDALTNLCPRESLAWMVSHNRLGDLRTYRHYRIERGHGLLEDHGDAAAAMTAHRFIRQGEQILAIEADGSRRL